VLGLRDVEILVERAETVGQMAAHREQYDWALARALAGMPTLVEYLLPLVRRGGHALAQKGSTGPAEAEDASRVIDLLGGRVLSTGSVPITGLAGAHSLIVVEKIGSTPPDYPRRVGLPQHSPLTQ